MNGEVQVAAVILAAGGSSRLGRPKQLVPYRGRSLVRHACETALASRCRPCVVVLGSFAGAVAAEVAGLDLHCVVNDVWHEGMGATIRCGIAALESLYESKPVQAALIVLCDQPLVTPDLLNNMISLYSAEGAPIVAAKYAGKCAVPALFARRLWPELAALQGDNGARKVLERHSEVVQSICFAEGAVDVDSPADLLRLPLN